MLKPSCTRRDADSLQILLEVRRTCIATLQTPYLVVDGGVLNHLFCVTVYSINTKYVVFTRRVRSSNGASSSSSDRLLSQPSMRCCACVELTVFLSTRSHDSLRLSASMRVSHALLRHHLQSYSTRFPIQLGSLFFHLEQRRFVSTWMDDDAMIYLPLSFHTKGAVGESAWI